MYYVYNRFGLQMFDKQYCWFTLHSCHQTKVAFFFFRFFTSPIYSTTFHNIDAFPPINIPWLSVVSQCHVYILSQGQDFSVIQGTSKYNRSGSGSQPLISKLKTPAACQDAEWSRMVQYTKWVCNIMMRIHTYVWSRTSSTINYATNNNI